MAQTMFVKSTATIRAWPDLNIIVIADTPFIAAAVVDSLPNNLPYLLIGPRSIAFLRRSASCRGYFVNDLSLEESNKDDFAQTIQRLVRISSNIFLIPADDSANRIVNATLDQLGANIYPIPDSACFETLNDKWQFYLYCRQLGVQVPETIQFGDKTEIDFEHVGATVGVPFVLKPTNKSYCLGVQLIHSKAELEQKILTCPEYQFSPLIAQSFIPGLDIDISALVDRGHIQKFAVQTKEEDTLCFVQNEDLVKSTEVVVRECCYTGVIHIDARLHDKSGEIFLVEANPRFWGSLAAATAAGLNFVRAGIFTSMGSESPDPVTIFNVSVPSTRRILAEILTFRRSYLRMHPLERLRLKRGMRGYIQSILHRP
jgi:ATP-grasp in the biosynthetic pathway with Ter operon